MRRSALLLLWFSFLATSCAKNESPPEHPLREAYHLLDSGDNAKAILLLQGYLKTNPKSEEAMTLLASALMGQAGINIFSIFDHFKDIFFKDSLANTFWNSSNEDLRAAPSSSEDTALESSESSVLKTVLIFDRFLEYTRRVGSLLARFPEVKPQHWPLLTQALAVLNGLNSRDIALYRVFIRVVHVRAFLAEKVLKDSTFSTRAWACSIDLGSLEDSLDWLSEQLLAAAKDYQLAKPEGELRFEGILGATQFVHEALGHLNSNDVEGAHSGLIGLQARIRSTFECKRSR